VGYPGAPRDGDAGVVNMRAHAAHVTLSGSIRDAGSNGTISTRSAADVARPGTRAGVRAWGGRLAI